MANLLCVVPDGFIVSGGYLLAAEDLLLTIEVTTGLRQWFVVGLNRHRHSAREATALAIAARDDRSSVTSAGLTREQMRRRLLKTELRHYEGAEAAARVMGGQLFGPLPLVNVVRAIWRK